MNTHPAISLDSFPPGARGVAGRLAAVFSPGLIALLVCLPALGAWCALTPDGIDYLSTARTLRETGHLPRETLARPPGFPVLLAPLMGLGDTPFLAIRLLLTGCLGAASVMTWRLYRAELGPAAAWLAGALVAMNAALLMQTTVVLSEMVFLPMSLGVLLFIRRWERGDREGIPGPASGAPAHTGVRGFEICAGGLLAAAAILVRAMGVALLPVAVIVLLADRRRRRRWARAGLFLLSAAAPLVAWELRQAAWPPAYSYTDVWTTAREAERTDATGRALQAERLARWGPRRLDDLKAAIVPNRLGWRLFQPPLDRPSSWLIGGFFVCLSLFRVVRDRSAVDAYCLLTLLMLAFWPWDEGVRLVIPLVPILIGNLLGLAERAWRRPGAGTRQRAAVGACVGLCLLAYAGERIALGPRLDRHREKAERRIAAMHALAEGLLVHGSPDAGLPAEGAGPVRRLCITPDGHNDKLLLAGAGYLARREIDAWLDVHADLPAPPAIDGPCDVFVHGSLLEAVRARWGWRPVKTCGAFALCRPGAREPAGGNEKGFSFQQGGGQGREWTPGGNEKGFSFQQARQDSRSSKIPRQRGIPFTRAGGAVGNIARSDRPGANGSASGGAQRRGAGRGTGLAFIAIRDARCGIRAARTEPSGSKEECPP